MEANTSHMLPGLLAAYGLLHIFIRLVISKSAELDEAEQLLLSQSFAFGYTDKPPLYTWLQMLFFAIFGVNIFSLALLKNLLLFATHLCLFLAARIVLRTSYLAVLTALSLWLVPQIAWESHRDLTHSVLATSISASVFYVMVKLLRTGHTWQYVTLGLLLGLGALSKPNFMLFATALFAAVMSQRALRAQLLDRRLILTFGLAAMLVLPHSLWLLDNVRLITSQAAQGLALHVGAPSVATIATDLFKLISASVRFVTPWWLVCLVLFPQTLRPRSTTAVDRGVYHRLLERFFLAVFGILVAVVILFEIKRFKDRWMQPFLFLVPLYVFLRLRDASVVPGRLKAFAYVLACFGLLFLGAPLAQEWGGPWFGIYSRLHIPFTPLAQQLRAAGFSRGTIAAGDVVLGGNLRLAFAESRVLTPKFAPAKLPRPVNAGQCLVVWNSRDGDTVPIPLRRLAEDTSHRRLPTDQAARHVEARLERSSREIFQLSFLLFPDGLGDCR
jgi:4-amino-4-deoxy-L-arabinose transferase-like glycosyltransferase